MEPMPHRYCAEAEADAEGPVEIRSSGLESLSSAPPAQFGGPGDRWSPETLLVAAVADCFILTFRAVARASRIEWISLRCEGEGELDRVDQTTRFTRISLGAHLTLASGQSLEKAERALEKAEQSCLVSRSLACPVALHSHVAVSEPADPALS